MHNLNVMLKPASSLCNLRCKYCFYADVASHREIDSYGVMTQADMRKMISHVLEDLSDGDSVTFAFQGGEPTLAGLDYFKSFISYVNENKKHISVNYALQTNATLLNDEWCAFLKENHFLLGVSLDGFEKNHDMCRLDAKGNGTFKTVLFAVTLLKKYRVEFNVLMTLTNSLARHPVQVWKFIEQQDFRYVQFTPCLAPLDAAEKDSFALTPSRFASFYIQLFHQWKEAFTSGNYYSIKLFDDIVSLLAVGEVNSCGLTGHCAPQIVVEADGSTYPCDFYTLDRWRIGNLCEQSVSQILQSPVIPSFLTRERKRELCADCRYIQICNGACQRMQPQICYSEGDKSCGYREFLDAVIADFVSIARNERLYRRQAGKI